MNSPERLAYEGIDTQLNLEPASRLLLPCEESHEVHPVL